MAQKLLSSHDTDGIHLIYAFAALFFYKFCTAFWVIAAKSNIINYLSFLINFDDQHTR